MSSFHNCARSKRFSARGTSTTSEPLNALFVQNSNTVGLWVWSEHPFLKAQKQNKTTAIQETDQGNCFSEVYLPSSPFLKTVMGLTLNGPSSAI
jgi:hypothetical protein